MTETLSCLGLRHLNDWNANQLRFKTFYPVIIIIKNKLKLDHYTCLLGFLHSKLYMYYVTLCGDIFTFSWIIILKLSQAVERAAILDAILEIYHGTPTESFL